MGVNDPIQGVSVGLGKKPNPTTLALSGAGGTATILMGQQEAATLRRGGASQPGPLVVDYLVGADPLLTVTASKFATNQRIRVQFIRLSALEYRPLGPDVEVTFRYGACGMVGKWWSSTQNVKA